MKEKIRICAVIVDRANYGRLWPVLKEIKNDSKFDLKIICTGTMVLERFGTAKNVVENDGFEISKYSYNEIEGSSPESMSRSIGLSILDHTNFYTELKPDIVLIIGDRYEALGATIAAAYSNYFIAHIQGGEVSGSIDECARHAISKFSHLHFPSTERSKEFLIKMGENPKMVHNVGCPVGDYILQLDSNIDSNYINSIGVGSNFDLERPFLLVIYHPDTKDFGQEGKNVINILSALENIGLPCLWIWPNIDAGSNDISKELRRFRENNKSNTWLHLIKNIEPQIFQKLLSQTSCAVGNSSSFVRDSTFVGTPVVLIGERQNHREKGANCITTEASTELLTEAINTQLKHGRYKPDNTYGVGDSSIKIVKILKETNLNIKKELNYL